MTAKIGIILATVAATCAAVAAGNGRPEESVECPVSANMRGHENTEWSQSYAYHLVDGRKNLPRVLLVGDSIVNGYQGEARRLLEAKGVNVTYWISSYCVTSPHYLTFLGIYLDEAKYDVIHFNNGLHSCETPVADYEKAYRNALRLVKDRQPGAKIVWASSTPLNATDSRAGKVAALNAAARRAAESVGDVAENDLYALANPLDRKAYWVDTHHYTSDGYELLASQVVEKITAPMATSRDGGTD